MSITAIITSHDYGRYIDQCIESCKEFCDEVYAYDDGSTDDSVARIRAHDIPLVTRHLASGSPCWGSNLGIMRAETTHVVFVDADNYLIADPPETEADYTFAALSIVDDEGKMRDLWEYHAWPRTVAGCMDKFCHDLQIPAPAGGVWRTEFIKGKRWRTWEGIGIGPDFATMLDWFADSPTLDYDPVPFLAYRYHPGRLSDRDHERGEMRRQARAYADHIRGNA